MSRRHETAADPYRAWSDWLDAFGRGDDLPLDHLPPVDGSVGPYMYQRLSERIAQALIRRIDLWATRLRRDLDGASRQGPLALGNVLAAARQQLVPLRRFAGCTLFDPEIRAALMDGLLTSVKSAQQSLDDSVRVGPQRGAHIAALRDSRLDAGLADPVPEFDPPRSRRPAPTPASGRSTAPTGRRVIL